MKLFNKIIIRMSLLSLLVLSYTSCKNLTDLNINPNGVSIDRVNPTLLMGSAMNTVASQYLSLGFDGSDGFAGVMQYTQKSYHNGGYNNYSWSNQDWNPYYNNLRNISGAYKVAKERGNKYIEGISLVIKSFVFGLLSDAWGDIPYTTALRGDEGGEFEVPAYDKQEDVYKGIIADLKEAVDILNALDNNGEYYSDKYYQGKPAKWAMFANSLRLRYFMRVSSKLESYAKDGINEIYQSGIFLQSADDDATFKYTGSNAFNSWPNNVRFVGTDGDEWRRVQMCQTFVDTLLTYNDPRLVIWADSVETKITISDTHFPNDPDKVDPNDGIRYIHNNEIPTGTTVNTDWYVGLPPAIQAPDAWNLNPQPGQQGFNVHVSHINSMYRETDGPLLLARMMSRAEVCFIFAEAALKWSAAGGNAEQWYQDGIKASLDTWGVESEYNNYYQNEVVYDGTVSQIITQKWIAGWTTPESWFDYRRTGYPELTSGPQAQRNVLPVRYMYPSNEYTLNEDKVHDATNGLEETGFSGSQGKDSPWSKMWVIQDTGQPW